jgi:hypothetical protein
MSIPFLCDIASMPSSCIVHASMHRGVHSRKPMAGGVVLGAHNATGSSGSKASDLVCCAPGRRRR